MADEKKLLLAPNNVYHIFAHAVHENNFFYKDEQKQYFLNRWKEYSNGMFRTYAYCLLSNHFHLCIQVENEEKLIESINLFRAKRKEKRPNQKPYEPVGIVDLPELINKHIGHFLNSYTQSLNKQLDRKGTLVRENFGRIFVHSRDYLKDLICYIHHNPIHHFQVQKYSDWAYSSYNYYAFKEENEFLQKENIIRLFGSIEEFVKYHAHYKEKKQFETIENLVIGYIH